MNGRRWNYFGVVGVVSVTAAALSCNSCAAKLSARRSATPVPADSGGKRPSAAEAEYLRAKIAAIASCWVQADAKRFVDFWSSEVELGRSAEVMMAEIEEWRKIAHDAGREGENLTFLSRFGTFIAGKSKTASTSGVESRSDLHSDSTRRFLEQDLKRYFAGLDASGLLAVETIDRNPISTLDESSTAHEKSGWVPREWVVLTQVSSAAQERGFSKQVTFTFRFGDNDWKLTGIFAFP
jgi:hypothetical protein